MRSDIITIENNGRGFSDAVEQTRKVAEYKGLPAKDEIQLKMLTEEMLSLARSVTGEMQASFWIEYEDDQVDLHMTTETVMNREKRDDLLSAATSRKNEAAKTVLGKIRDMFEQARLTDAPHAEIPTDVLADISQGDFADEDWDGYERSILRTLADEVKIGIRGNLVEVTVTKRF